MDLHVYQIGLRTRFRGITTREGLLLRGPAGWAEWSPFLEYDDAEALTWWRAAVAAAETGFPAPVRDRVPVNVTVPAVDAATAREIVARSGCRTAKVKVAEAGQSLADDLDRVAAVREALGPDGLVRIDANGGWSVDDALVALQALAPYQLEYAEQPCLRTEDLAALRLALARQGVDIPIAADESIRKSGDPMRVKQLQAADVAVLKVQPLGGVDACLRIAEQIGLPVVVSSALESSVGIRMGVALAAALPELPYACGLNTVALFDADPACRSLVAEDGTLPVVPLGLDEDRLAGLAAPPERERWWRDRLARVQALAGKEARA